MTRRHALSLVGRIAATATGQVFFSSWLAAAHEHTSAAPASPDRWQSYSPQFLAMEEFKALDQFVTVLLPTDDTPGAREAHVAPFIDFVLSQATEYAPEMQDEWRQTVEWLKHQQFLNLPEAKQVSVLQAASQQSSADFTHFERIKDLAVYAFYTSRAGLIDNLQYQGLAYLTEFPGCDHPEHRSL